MDEEDLRHHVESYERFTAKVRKEMLDPEARKGNDNTLHATMETGIYAPRLLVGDYRLIAYFEPLIRDIWYMFIISATEHRRRPPRVRQAAAHHHECPGTAASCIRVVFGVDLPFLVPDVRDAWKRLMMMEPSASPRSLCQSHVGNRAACRIWHLAALHRICTSPVERDRLLRRLIRRGPWRMSTNPVSPLALQAGNTPSSAWSQERLVFSGRTDWQQ
ncbi:hypothetical protein HD806DRAFT_550084 [Xylariaceae sp. AK1471]|nr:hypothetical protein HD806DRAFT_550084 [Xylariaceae sp. AK1471]